MSAYFEAYHRREVRKEHVREILRDLIFSVLVRIDEELTINPDTTSFSTPLLVNSGIKKRISHSFLRDHPEIITRRIEPRIGHQVLLRLDEKASPPQLLIKIGERLSGEK